MGNDGLIRKTGSSNMSQRRQRRTEPRPRATYRKNSVKFKLMVPEMLADRQTDRQTCSSQYSAVPPTPYTGTAHDNYLLSPNKQKPS